MQEALTLFDRESSSSSSGESERTSENAEKRAAKLSAGVKGIV